MKLLKQCLLICFPPKYPKKLLPKIGFKQIRGNLNSFYLVRWYDSSFYNEEDSLPVGAICTPRDNIVDLSTSLLGTFKEKHYRFQVNKGGESLGYLDPWDFNKTCNRPQFEKHFNLRSKYSCWYVPIKSLQNLKVNFTTGAGKTEEKHEVVCSVLHTPVTSNYWHFSLNWIIDGKEARSIQPTEGWIRKMSHAARASLKIKASKKGPEKIKEIPEKIYLT